MNIEMQLHSAAEFEAFGEFCSKIAKKRAEHERNPPAYNLAADAIDIGLRTAAAQGLLKPVEQSGSPIGSGGLAQATVKQPSEPQTMTEVVIHQQATEQATPRRGRKPKTTEPAPNIQAEPENRVDPATEAQDAADEKAEQASAQGRPLSGDDVRAAMTDYMKRYGKVAAMEDGPKILGVAKISELGDDQEKLRKAVDDTQSAIANNPFERAVEAANG